MFVCSAPQDADPSSPLGTRVYILDIIPGNNRKNVTLATWEKYRELFSYYKIWIVSPSELAERVVVTTKFHRGEV